MLEHLELGLLPYFPLESGMLTGKYKRDAAGQGRLADNFLNLGNAFLTERNFDVVEELECFASARGRTLLELAISWLAAQRVVSSVICGATRPEQVEQNSAAAEWKFSTEELSEIDRITAV